MARPIATSRASVWRHKIEGRQQPTGLAARKRLACGQPGIPAIEFSYFSLDRFLGDFLFRVPNNFAAEGGGGTALSKTIASADTSFP